MRSQHNYTSHLSSAIQRSSPHLSTNCDWYKIYIGLFRCFVWQHAKHAAISCGRKGWTRGRASEKRKCIFFMAEKSSVQPLYAGHDVSTVVARKQASPLYFGIQLANLEISKVMELHVLINLLSFMGNNYYPVGDDTSHNLRAEIVRLPLCFAMLKAPAFNRWIHIRSIRFQDCKIHRFPTFI